MNQIAILPRRFRYRVHLCDVWFFGCLFPGTEFAESKWCIVSAKHGGGAELMKTDDPESTAALIGASELEWIDGGNE